MTLNTGTKLGRYEIRSQLGAGGMGEVYLAQDAKLDRKVALRLLLIRRADAPEFESVRGANLLAPGRRAHSDNGGEMGLRWWRNVLIPSQTKRYLDDRQARKYWFVSFRKTT